MSRKSVSQSNAQRRNRELGRGDSLRRKPSLLVRPVEVSDFEFVRRLAARIEGYTVPPTYVLWMFCRFYPQFCVVAEGPRGVRLAYLLAMPVEVRSGAVFVWQVASTFKGQRLHAGTELAQHLRTVAGKQDRHRILFTTVPRSASEKLVTSLAERVFHTSPRLGSPLPKSASVGEYEYSLFVQGKRSKRPC
jgi:hypothetical protein